MHFAPHVNTFETQENIYIHVREMVESVLMFDGTSIHLASQQLIQHSPNISL
jgi:hypothetical protein